MKMLSLAIGLWIACASSLANATMTIINFESLKKSDASFTFLTGEYFEDGFTLAVSDPTPYSFASAGDLNARYAGSTALTTYNFGSVSIVNTAGLEFDFISIDVAPVFLGADDPFGPNRDLSAVYQTMAYGLKWDGSVVSQVITLPNVSVANILTTVQMVGFTGLKQLAMSNTTFPGVQFDNLVMNTVSTVPESSQAMLLLTGIIMLSGMRFKKRQKSVSLS